MKSKDKNFAFDLCLQGNQIKGLSNKFQLLLTDHIATKTQIGFSVVVGEVKGVENFVAFGVRTSETSFILDLVDLEKNSIYDVYMVDDFVGVFSNKFFVEIDDREVCSNIKLNYVLKKSNKEANANIDNKLIESFEDKVLNYPGPKCNFRQCLVDLLTSDKYMNSVTTNMVKELQTMEIKVYVNTIFNYFKSYPNINIEGLVEDKKFAKKFKRVIKYGNLTTAYKLFSEYPSEVYTLYDKMKENNKNVSAFAEYEDMTEYLKQ